MVTTRTSIVFLGIALVSAAFFSACANSPAEKAEVVLDSSYYTNKFNYTDSDSLLGRGINLGNCFEGIKTDEFPLSEGSWSGGHKIALTDLERIRSKGFKNIRIPARWSDHASKTDTYTIDETFLTRVKEVVDQAIATGFIVVLNTHHYTEMMSDPAEKLAGHRARLNGIWDQLCDAFPIGEYSANILIFELLNEPNGTVGYSDWNSIINSNLD